MRLGLSALLVLAFIAGCGRGDPGKKVLARVGDRKITVSDFDDGYRRIAAQDTSIHAGYEGRRQALDSMIDKTLLEEAATETYPYFNESQKERLRTFREGELKRAVLTREVDAKIHVPEEDIRALWESRDTRYKVSHIFLPTREEADAALSMLQQGASFVSVAAAHSHDAATAAAGGAMDWFTPGWGPSPEFEAATMALQLGGQTGIVPTSNGFEIIRLDEKAPAENRGSYESEHHTLDLVLRARQASRYTKEFRTRLFDEYAVEITPDAAGSAGRWIAERGAGVPSPAPRGGEVQAVMTPIVHPVLPSEDSTMVLVSMRPANVADLLRDGALGDSAWVRARLIEDYSLADYAGWLSERPQQLWPDATQGWDIVRSISDMAFDEALLREALSTHVYEQPDIAARFRERENRTRVVRFHRLEVELKADSANADLQEVYRAGPDRYRRPMRYVVATFTSLDSAAAAEVAKALRSGETMARAAAPFADRGPSVKVNPESHPDTLAPIPSSEIAPALAALTEPGQVSGPVLWQGRNHSVFKLVEILPERAMSFDDARPYVEQDAKTLAQEKRLKEVLDGVRARHPVKVNESLLRKIPDPGKNTEAAT